MTLLWPRKKLVEKEHLGFWKIEKSQQAQGRGVTSWEGRKKMEPGREVWRLVSGLGTDSASQPEANARFTIWPLKEEGHPLRDFSPDVDCYHCKGEKHVYVRERETKRIGVLNTILKNFVCLKRFVFFFCLNLFFEPLFHLVLWTIFTILQSCFFFLRALCFSWSKPFKLALWSRSF